MLERKYGVPSDTHVPLGRVLGSPPACTEALELNLSADTGMRRQDLSTVAECEQFKNGEKKLSLCFKWLTDEAHSLRPDGPHQPSEDEKHATLGLHCKAQANEHRVKDLPVVDHSALSFPCAGASRPVGPNADQEPRSEERRVPQTMITPKSWQDRYRPAPRSPILDARKDEGYHQPRLSLDST